MRTITIRNWSAYSHIIKVPYTENFDEFLHSVCIEAQSCPINIYFLGELKGTDNRIKINSDALLKDSLERIYSWKPMGIPIMPELLFELVAPQFIH
jgi:hypothetical protein